MRPSKMLQIDPSVLASFESNRSSVSSIQEENDLEVEEV